MLEKIKELLYTFSCVVTGVLFACALFITIFHRDNRISVAVLWEILFTSFVCTCGNLLYPYREISTRQEIVRRVLHYLYINAVVFGCAALFGWYDLKNLRMSGFMFCCILLIFLVVSWLVWRHSSKVSQALNSQLKRYQEKKIEEGAGSCQEES